MNIQGIFCQIEKTGEIDKSWGKKERVLGCEWIIMKPKDSDLFSRRRSRSKNKTRPMSKK